MGIQNEYKAHSNSTCLELLLPKEGSFPFEAKWSYRSLVGKLIYLAKKKTDIEYGVNRFALYQ